MKLIKVREMVYVVQSETRGDSQNYTINLKDNQNMGSCTCSQFKFRVHPKWKGGVYCAPCKHIIYALGEAVWQSVNKSLTKQGNEH